jgi:hypothetical protein
MPIFVGARYRGKWFFPEAGMVITEIKVHDMGTLTESGDTVVRYSRTFYHAGTGEPLQRHSLSKLSSAKGFRALLTRNMMRRTS